METIEFTRKELYDIVWSITLSKLTEQYAYTNDGVKKICKQFDIPMPDGSYWSKLKFNKQFKKEKLDPLFSGVDKIILRIREEGNPININQTPLTIRTKEIENDVKSPLIVPEKLSRPDILIQNTKDIYNRRKKERYYWNDKIDSVSISVQDAHLDRALRIMDTFIKLLRFRGHTFRRDRNNRGPLIVVKDVEFYFSLREAQKRIPSEKVYESSTYLPTGILVIKIGESYHTKEWKDGSVKLENQLAKIVAKIELEADEELIWREKSRLQTIEREKQEKIKQEFEARREKEITKTKKLFSDAEKYDKATIYRNFIIATEQKAIKENNLTDELKDWIKWATEKADWFDPFTNRQDELLNNKDKEDLHKPPQQNNYYRY
ncbi:MAG: hypothetical protein RLZZ529_195 [Bacteroidota bacterium]|jgi:hypothetical protein